MTDDLVARLREVGNKNGLMYADYDTTIEAADRIEQLEYALRSIAEVPIGEEIPDRTTIWGLAKHMRETAKDALKEGER